MEGTKSFWQWSLGFPTGPEVPLEECLQTGVLWNQFHKTAAIKNGFVKSIWEEVS